MYTKLKNAIGVTLLEIMLVLAVAAMVIVMSIKYYDTANTSQMANLAMNQIQAITAAADNIGIGTGDFSGIAANGSNVANIVAGTDTLTSATGGTVTITGGTAASYTVGMVLNKSVCPSVDAKLAAIKKITTHSCDSDGKLTYTYTYQST